MRSFLTITKALSDETRVRALLALRGGELCLCQIIDLLQLAPSTVSKHMDLLYQAGLVQRRKQGRWHYFSLISLPSATPPTTPAGRALRWVFEALHNEPGLKADAKKLCCVRKKGLDEVSACYREN